MVIRATQPTRYRWTVEQYHRFAELGLLHDQRTELLDGEIIVAAPRLEEHLFTVMLVRRALERAMRSPGYLIREEKPTRLGGGSEPEPDIAVVPGTLEHFPGSDPPQQPALVVEVSASTVDSDIEKIGLYAREGIPEVWQVDVRAREVRVFTAPEAAPGLAYGHRYSVVRVVSGNDVIDTTLADCGPVEVRAMLLPRKL